MSATTKIALSFAAALPSIALAMVPGSHISECSTANPCLALRLAAAREKQPYRSGIKTLFSSVAEKAQRFAKQMSNAPYPEWGGYGLASYMHKKA